ncbi:glycoside hydrolase family 88 protein [Galbibacter mesophilus]|uniref:glycoside hydrolase family 88 protein n=1 Tax=Galbibacter mesophilus TaxID=379069 RepID=UPI00191CAFBE|nr:glycoside hydrolase family 88 protein [Galbibacter mesophilus]MCM5662402.1 glycoside hydrolase family 88 protein [Galbibacter mesophilus]
MIKLVNYFLASAVLVSALSCKQKWEIKEVASDEVTSISSDSLLKVRYQKLLDYAPDSLSFPRSYSEEKGIRKVNSRDWTAGFFPGSLWKIYQLTNNPAYKKQAAVWTDFMEKEKYDTHTHDTGFKVFCSFGSGLQTEENEAYEDVVVQTAKTLSTRFNENVGCIRSWDFNAKEWEFPVIIDNMMNLELLFEATKISGDSSYYKIAEKHANTTLENHFRSDNSTYHVVVYDSINGSVKDKVTHQGFNDESGWARGQAWAIYGYTMTYRYTKDPKHLDIAKAVLDYYLNHDNLPKDGIPYWDFNDPDIPNAPRDVSAATIVASACLELYSYTESDIYLNYANKVLENLKSEEYLLNPEVEAPFILKHSTGNWPKNDEIDEPINYGDYYFLEALVRQKGSPSPN